ncbi:hypothetical protein GE061_004459 [Apolygus lucorum]|uniref:F-box domain-containing protein n=1 Tax=Apolygus lucorum TaxID=248454 RepID=A0A8S9WZ91_APOLU|nr:hypothetical protein GE061_004459 [Apolygus lucorum]
MDIVLCAEIATAQPTETREASLSSKNELCRARAVCRTWWEIINCDHLWKPKLLERRITNDCVDLDTEGDVSLKNCEWANTCFKYYNTAIRTWELLSASLTVDYSLEFVLIHLPYMLKTFDPDNVIELLRLSNGSFVPWAKIPLPKDPEEGCYEPQMTCSDTFAVSKNSYTVIFKLRDGSFCFEKVISFVDDNSLTSCSNESKAPGFLRDTYERRPRSVSCLAIFQDVVWIYESSLNVLIVWDYLKSEVELRIDSETLHSISLYGTPLIHTAESRVYHFLPGEVSIYLPQGQRLWFYKDELMDSLFNSFCSNQFGCGFIEKDHFAQRAVYYNATKVSLVYLKVEFPISVQLDEYCDLAYCLSCRDKSLYVSCLSTSSGERLWESKLCSLMQYDQFKIANRYSNIDDLLSSMKMKVVLKKYIVIQGMGRVKFDPELNNRLKHMRPRCIIELQKYTQSDVSLKNCEWANTCFKYYDTVIRTWNQWSPSVTECPPSTEFVLIHLPYMLRTFDPYNVIELLRLSNGSFAPWAKIPLPKDPEEGCYEPQMTCSDTFAVSKNSYTVIFKLRDESFYFEKVISFFDGNSLTSCSNESKAPGFLRDTYQRRPGGSVSCLAIFQDVVWIYETFLNVLVVWDYLKSEVKLRIDSETLQDVPLYDTPLIHTAESRVYQVLAGEVSIYLPQGQRLWFYKHKLMDNLFNSFCSNQFGCGFIEKNHSAQRAIYYNATKVSLVYFEVEFPISVQLDEYCDLAYCLSCRDKSLSVTLNDF